MIKKKQKTNYLIVFLIIAVLAVVIFIQQTSPQVTQAGDLGDIFSEILRSIKLSEEANADLFKLEEAQKLKQLRETRIAREISNLENDVRLANADRIQQIKIDIARLRNNATENSLALGKIKQDIANKQLVIKKIGEEIEGLSQESRKYTSGRLRKFGKFKNPFLICAIGLTLNFCFGVDPVLAAIDEASPDPRIPNPADFAEEELKAFEKAREGVLDDLDEIFPTP